MQKPEALQRANYLIQRGLSVDAVQEIYSVKNPSTELQQVIQEIATRLCDSE
ncbi:hypothetical protein [Leptodesmis sichuanensis]|uniref:hypothetical protein n=1 Tax=Leptodesmis sichuanensis TaxID=2906798 RepID=UPI001F4366FB|nr:hypothetical protein [Leptodesmis sichuanensis]UIE36165.1 hypothetical protein KIK02_13875 [Leptodesmis sichuanensis A121]